jgi:hypothetical protein
MMVNCSVICVMTRHAVLKTRGIVNKHVPLPDVSKTCQTRSEVVQQVHVLSVIMGSRQLNVFFSVCANNTATMCDADRECCLI